MELRTTLSFVFVFSLITVYTTLSVILFQRQKRKRCLQPPEEQVALRGPGESLRRKSEKLLENLAWTTTITGAVATAIAVSIPGLVLSVTPNANIWLLLGSSLALFLAASVWVVRRSVRIMAERANARLGWIGENRVAEHLQACQQAGFRVLHDIPFSNDGFTFNIDHVAFGPGGVVVIETKMRSKPADQPSGAIQVKFDGKKLDWPRFSNDTKTVWQVRKNAEFLQENLSRELGINLPVRQVIAIPGWKVVELKCEQPRIVSGRGVSNAVIQSTQANPAGLSREQVDRIGEWLESHCRDVEL